MRTNKWIALPVFILIIFIPFNQSFAQSNLDGVFNGLDFLLNSLAESEIEEGSESSLFFEPQPGESNIIVENATKLLGLPYVYGKQGPDAFDCSGLTSYVFKQAGIIIPRTSLEQGNSGKPVSKEELQPGDLVFFDTRSTNDPSDIGVDTSDLIGLLPDLNSTQSSFIPSKVTHVGIYLGQNKFIHASSGAEMKVVVADLNNKYFTQRYLFAKRYL